MTDGKKYIFQNSIDNPNNFSPRYKMFASKEEMLGNLIISIYDTPQTKPPLQNNSGTFNNGIIDFYEFNDTKEEYEKKIEKIKQYCKKYNQDISDIKLPTYQEMVTLCSSNADIETITSFLRPKKSLEEEIGLSNLKYEIKERSAFREIRTYENGTIVTIHYADDVHYEQIYIENDNKKITKRFNWSTGAITNQKIFDNKKKTNTITDYYSNGNIQAVRIRDLEANELVEQTNYDKYGNRILNDNQKLAQDLIQDLNHTNFIGIRSVRSSLQENLNKITTENIEQVLREYKQTTGKSLIQAIEYARGSIDSLYETFTMQSYTTTDKIKDQIRECLIKKYPQDKVIRDMSSFLEDTGIDDEFKYLLDNKSANYNDFEIWWKELTGRDSFESDILNSNLPQEIKAQYNRVIWHEACSRLNIKPNLKIENSQIKNEYYKSDMVYDVQYNLTTDCIGGSVTVINKTTGITHTIDVLKLADAMSEIDFCEFLSDLQTYPAEALEDMAIDLSKITGHSGNESKLLQTGFDGIYFLDDKKPTIFNSEKKETNIHELGHSVDFTYLFGENQNMSCHGSFYKTFNTELKEYLRKGHKQFVDEDNTTHDQNNWNYCTKNECEMFAECYTLLMTGNCDSKDTILKYFEKTLKEAETLLKEIRKLPDDTRLKK